MSGAPRLQVLAGGAFLSPAKVLRVMKPAHDEQLCILDRRWNNPGQRRWFPAADLGPLGSSEAAAEAPGLRSVDWAARRCQQPSPTRVRGGAPGRGGLERPEGGPRRRSAPGFLALTRIPQGVQACWVRGLWERQPG